MAFNRIEQVAERIRDLRERGVIDRNQQSHAQHILAGASRLLVKRERKAKIEEAIYALDAAEAL